MRGEGTAAVLVVDGDDRIRVLLRAILAPRGYRVLEAARGERALELARRERPAVVLLDVVLRDLDGYELCRRIKVDPGLSGTAVVVVTARADAACRGRGAAAGADVYLTKPFLPSALLAIVDRLAAVPDAAEQ